MSPENERQSHLHTDIYGNRGRLINQEAYIAIHCDKL